MIGTQLAERLRGRGDEVWILTRRSPRSEHEIQWDPSRGVQSPRLLEGVDALFNLVGEHLADRPWTKARRKLLVDSRVQATETLLGSLAELDAPPSAYVGVGSLGIFGDRGDAFIDDEDPPGSGFLADLCVAWEQAHLSAEEALGARVSILRMSVVLSPTGGAFPLMVQPFRYVGGWLGNGRQYSPWISIRDCVGGLVHLAQCDRCSGGFNGTVPTPTPNKEWLRALGRVMHRPVVTHAPKWALRGALGELAESLFLASIRAVPRKLLETGYIFTDPDAEEMFRWLLPAFERERERTRGEGRRRRW
ncbi:MAG TPA: TIGR01777 family protein [Deltaproteobacteria bacterium]|nr:TIGR01777 family protein [Deltaproteobacteria bacterium]